MCLQDLRIQSSSYVDYAVVTIPASGRYTLGDLRTATLVYGNDGSDTFSIQFDVEDWGTQSITSDAEYFGGAENPTTLRVYSRKNFSGYPPGKLFVPGTPGSQVLIVIHRYGADVDSAVSSLRV